MVFERACGRPRASKPLETNSLFQGYKVVTTTGTTPRFFELKRYTRTINAF